MCGYINLGKNPQIEEEIPKGGKEGVVGSIFEFHLAILFFDHYSKKRFYELKEYFIVLKEL